MPVAAAMPCAGDIHPTVIPDLMEFLCQRPSFLNSGLLRGTPFQADGLSGKVGDTPIALTAANFGGHCVVRGARQE
jgi:hypothetical protein